MPSTRLIFRSYGQCGVRVSTFFLLKTSEYPLYSSGTDRRSCCVVSRALYEAEAARAVSLDNVIPKA